MPGKMLRHQQEGPFPTSSCCSLLRQSNTRLKMISATVWKRGCMNSKICYAIYFIKDLSSALLRFTQILLTHTKACSNLAITQNNTSQCIQSVGRIEKHFSEIPLDNIQNFSKSKICFCSRQTAWFTPTCSKRTNVHTSMLSDDPMELQNQIYSIDKTRR